MNSDSASGEVKVEHDISSFKAEIISLVDAVVHDFQTFMAMVEPKMDEVYRMIADYPNIQEIREAFPPTFLVGIRIRSPRRARREAYTNNLVGTFWAPENLRESQ